MLANIPRSTYYYWLKNAKRPDPDADLKVLIQAVYHEHEGRYGYRRIRDELTNRGHKINHKKTHYERIRIKVFGPYEEISLL